MSVKLYKVETCQDALHAKAKSLFVYPEGSSEPQWQGSDITRIVLLKYLLGCDVEVGLMKSLQQIIKSSPAKHNKYQSYGYDRGMADGNTFKR